jgi:hypothetical protein
MKLAKLNIAQENNVFPCTSKQYFGHVYPASLNRCPAPAMVMTTLVMVVRSFVYFCTTEESHR